MIRRTVIAGATGAALVLSLTGCLGESGGDDLGGVRLAAAEAISRTSQQTKKLDTFRTNVKLTVDAPEGSVSMRGLARYRVRPRYGFHMTFTEIKIPGVPVPAGAHVLVVDDSTYVKAPIVSQLFGGKQWVKAPTDGTEGNAGPDFGSLVTQMRQVDPIANTQMLTASKDAREVGEETVDGVRTRHYKGTYSVRDAVAKLDRRQREQFEQGLTDSGLEKMNFDLWIDGRQLPRKLVLRSPSGAKADVTATVAYRDFGKRVNISAPPAGQVADLADLANGLGRSN